MVFMVVLSERIRRTKALIWASYYVPAKVVLERVTQVLKKKFPAQTTRWQDSERRGFGSAAPLPFPGMRHPETRRTSAE
jgi:hypothetical protein